MGLLKSVRKKAKKVVKKVAPKEVSPVIDKLIPPERTPAAPAASGSGSAINTNYFDPTTEASQSQLPGTPATAGTPYDEDIKNYLASLAATEKAAQDQAQAYFNEYRGFKSGDVYKGLLDEATLTPDKLALARSGARADVEGQINLADQIANRNLIRSGIDPSSPQATAGASGRGLLAASQRALAARSAEDLARNRASQTAQFLTSANEGLRSSATSGLGVAGSTSAAGLQGGTSLRGQNIESGLTQSKIQAERDIAERQAAADEYAARRAESASKYGSELGLIGSIFGAEGGRVGGLLAATRPYGIGGQVQDDESITEEREDRVNAVLTPDEYVMTAKATKYWGTRQLDAMNHEAEGGMGPAPERIAGRPPQAQQQPMMAAGGGQVADLFMESVNNWVRNGSDKGIVKAKEGGYYSPYDIVRLSKGLYTPEELGIPWYVKSEEAEEYINRKRDYPHLDTEGFFKERRDRERFAQAYGPYTPYETRNMRVANGGLMALATPGDLGIPEWQNQPPVAYAADGGKVKYGEIHETTRTPKRGLEEEAFYDWLRKKSNMTRENAIKAFRRGKNLGEEDDPGLPRTKKFLAAQGGKVHAFGGGLLAAAALRKMQDDKGKQTQPQPPPPAPVPNAAPEFLPINLPGRDYTYGQPRVARGGLVKAAEGGLQEISPWDIVGRAGEPRGVLVGYIPEPVQQGPEDAGAPPAYYLLRGAPGAIPEAYGKSFAAKAQAPFDRMRNKYENAFVFGEKDTRGYVPQAPVRFPGGHRRRANFTGYGLGGR